MCAIAGVISYGEFRASQPLLKQMCDRMRHRGPDGEGYWVGQDGRIGFGHRRLSIIDLSSAANQPMASIDGQVYVVFNGEIYNHDEIRAELEASGDRNWKTDHSDTEVLLHAYQRWGIDAVHRFRGMFAFALWDDRKRCLFLVRDRIGIKPLYYATYKGRVAFASEIKALLVDPELERAVNEEAMTHYLSFMTTPAPQTLFRGIFKLMPGTWLKIDLSGNQTEFKYWDVLNHAEPLTTVSEQEVLERLIAELRTSVRYRKVSDVPVGVFLSGGLDSSVNATLFKEGESRPVKTFSIGYEGTNRSYKNEFQWARQVANSIGSEHHELELSSNDLLDFLPRMVWLQDEPIGDAVCVPVYYVSKLARDNGVTVAQVGEGADELFCGYPRWRSLLKLEELDALFAPRALKRLGLTLLSGIGFGENTAYEWLRRATQGQPIFWGSADAFKDVAKKRVLSKRLRQDLGDCTSWSAIEPIYARFKNMAKEKSDLNWMTYMELNMRLPELLLMRVDKMSMGVSLEARVPFLDHKFVELAMSIPSEMKLRGNTTKYLLKSAVRGLLPDPLIDRPKQPFSVPIMDWFIDHLQGPLRAQIDEFSRATDLVDATEVERLFKQGRGVQLWILMNLAMWWKTFIATPQTL